MVKISFWSKESGNLMSHSGGLTNEQIQALKELKEGDRLILWHNKREKESDSSYTLKKFTPKEVVKEQEKE